MKTEFKIVLVVFLILLTVFVIFSNHYSNVAEASKVFCNSKNSEFVKNNLAMGMFYNDKQLKDSVNTFQIICEKNSKRSVYNVIYFNKCIAKDEFNICTKYKRSYIEK